MPAAREYKIQPSVAQVRWRPSWGNWYQKDSSYPMDKSDNLCTHVIWSKALKHWLIAAKGQVVCFLGFFYLAYISSEGLFGYCQNPKETPDAYLLACHTYTELEKKWLNRSGIALIISPCCIIKNNGDKKEAMLSLWNCTFFCCNKQRYHWSLQ